MISIYDILSQEMTKCAVLFCKNVSGKTSNISFHLFPTNPLRKRMWVKAVCREKTWIPTKYHRICSVHFEKESYNEEAKKQRKLHKDAIPTLNLPAFSRLSPERGTPTDDVGIAKKHKPCSPLPGSLCDNDLTKKIESRRNKLLHWKILEKNKKIKRLQHQNRCLKKKVTSLQETLDNLTDKRLISNEDKKLLVKTQD